MTKTTNKHPQAGWHIEQSIKDKLKVIAKAKGIGSVCAIARMILVEYIRAYEAEHGEIELK
jgi:hypothetical protein